MTWYSEQGTYSICWVQKHSCNCCKVGTWFAWPKAHISVSSKDHARFFQFSKRKTLKNRHLKIRNAHNLWVCWEVKQIIESNDFINTHIKNRSIYRESAPKQSRLVVAVCMTVLASGGDLSTSREGRKALSKWKGDHWSCDVIFLGIGMVLCIFFFF